MENKLEHSCTDALGAPIDPDAFYGYSRKSNGFTIIIIGKISHSTSKNKVTLLIESRAHCLYDSDPKKDGQGKDSVSVHSISLFKLDEDYVKNRNHKEQ